MEIPERKLIRLAETIQEQLRLLRGCRYGEVLSRIGGLMQRVEELQALRGRLTHCLGRNWHAATESVADSVSQALRELPYMGSEIDRAVTACKTKPPTVREVYEELRQLDEEFERVQYHHDSKLLCVVTDRIELEGVFLGDFEVQLHVPSLAEMRRNHAIYRIVALDPHPASSNEHVTHPHVSDERLCEGDASAAIEAALANGRVCDFFILVRSVLTNYNPDSPYIRLDEWDGTPCYDCGCSCSTDEMYFCESCERDFCSECYSCCRVCDASMCSGCLTRCQGCDHHVCGECMTSCDVCGESFCKNCLSECKECGDHVCDGCLATCDKCSKQFCTTCIKDGVCLSCAKETTLESKEIPNEPEQAVPCGASSVGPDPSPSPVTSPRPRRRRRVQAQRRAG